VEYVSNGSLQLLAGYYHQVIMMSGTDLSLYGVVRPFYRPRQYGHRLATALGCSTADSYLMMECLRSTNITWEDFVREQRKIIPNVSWIFAF